MSEEIKIKSLFDSLPPYLAPYACECEYPWELIARVEEIVGELLGNAPEGYREIEKGILVGENVSIADSARIEPPAIIGKNSEIRHRCKIFQLASGCLASLITQAARLCSTASGYGLPMSPTTGKWLTSGK